MNIVVAIKGGLGNQMFEYAMARALQIEYPGAKLILDISKTHRPFALGIFELINHVETIKDCRYFKYHIEESRFLRIITKYFPRLTCNFFQKKGVFFWNHLSYMKIPKIENDIFINGYWQSVKYFDLYKMDILKDFEFMMPIAEKNEFLMKEIINSESVCVHVRLGDYCYQGNEDYQVCKPEYYLKCIEELKNELKKACFFVFSDEIEKAKEFFKTCSAPIIYVEADNAPHEDLQLMSLCKHFVISNSTFSWWAQYLSQNPNKIVYAPDKWMQSGRNGDIYLASWRRR